MISISLGPGPVPNLGRQEPTRWYKSSESFGLPQVWPTYVEGKAWTTLLLDTPPLFQLYKQIVKGFIHGFIFLFSLMAFLLTYTFPALLWFRNKISMRWEDNTKKVTDSRLYTYPIRSLQFPIGWDKQWH